MVWGNELTVPNRAITTGTHIKHLAGQHRVQASCCGRLICWCFANPSSWLLRAAHRDRRRLKSTPLQPIFKTSPLTFHQWMVVLGFSLMPATMIEMGKLVVQRWER